MHTHVMDARTHSLSHTHTQFATVVYTTFFFLHAGRVLCVGGELATDDVTSAQIQLPKKAKHTNSKPAKVARK